MHWQGHAPERGVKAHSFVQLGNAALGGVLEALQVEHQRARQPAQAQRLAGPHGCAPIVQLELCEVSNMSAELRMGSHQPAGCLRDEQTGEIYRRRQPSVLLGPLAVRPLSSLHSATSTGLLRDSR